MGTDDGRTTELRKKSNREIGTRSKNTKAEAIKLDDNTCDETKETADLPMADQNVAESRELTSYIPRRSNRNRAVIDQPQGGSEAVKVVTMGNQCSSCTNCAWACSVLNWEIGRSTDGCKATPGSSKNTSGCTASSGYLKHQTRRTGNQVASRKIVHKKGTSNKNTGKEIVRTGRTSDERSRARGRDNNSLNKRQSLKGKYRRMDTMRWVNEN